jgi:hypothetical protein
MNDSLASLVKKVNKATSDNKSCKMGSFVILCSDAKGLDEKAKEFAEKENIKNTILARDSESGPQGYQIAKDAEVTVLLYQAKTVKANFSFKKGEMKEADIEKILKELPKITEK